MSKYAESTELSLESAVNPFDYLNASSWVEDKDLAARLQNDNAEKIEMVMAVFNHPMYPGEPLNISQIMATYGFIHGPAACPKASTMRAHLNAAIKHGKVAKWTRQTYGVPGVTKGQPEANAADAPDTGDDE